MMCKRPVRDGAVPAVCIGAPALSWCIQWALNHYFHYQTGFELLIMNALLTMAGLLMLQRRKA